MELLRRAQLSTLISLHVFEVNAVNFASGALAVYPELSRIVLSHSERVPSHLDTPTGVRCLRRTHGR